MLLNVVLGLGTAGLWAYNFRSRKEIDGVLKSMLAIKVNKKSILHSLVLQGFQGFKNCLNFNQHTF